MANNEATGQCPACKTPNPYTLMMCNMCGARLPWAAQVPRTPPPSPAPSRAPMVTPAPAPPPSPAPAVAPVAAKPNSSAAVWLLAVILVFAVPYGCSMLTGSPTSRTGIPTLSAPVATMSEYNQLQNGMTVSQVQAIIGDSGEQVSSNHIDGAPGVMEPIDTVMYSWQNGDGSNMNAMFQNDAMMSKAQLGLP